MYLLTAEEAGKVESVRDAETCDMADTPVEHITATCHHETYVVASLENLGSSLDEILRSLLVSDTSEEGNDLLLDISLDLELLPAGEVNGIVDSYNLFRLDSITIDTDISCELTHSHYLVSRHHTLCLKVNNSCIDLIVACTVV